MIELKNVSKWYDSFQALYDCSFSVEREIGRAHV